MISVTACRLKNMLSQSLGLRSCDKNNLAKGALCKQEGRENIRIQPEVSEREGVRVE